MTLTSDLKAICAVAVLDQNGHAFDKRTGRCIWCGAKYWDVVAEMVKNGKPN